MSVKNSAFYDSAEQHALHPRRNPLTPELLKRKRQELAKHRAYQETHAPDYVYALAYGSKESPIFFYVGVTRDVADRFQQHINAAINNDPAPKYVRLREAGWSKVFPVTLGEVGELTEDDWIQTLRAEGYHLENEVGGTGKRKRKTIAQVAEAIKPSATFRKVMANPTQAQLVLKKSS